MKMHVLRAMPVLMSDVGVSGTILNNCIENGKTGFREYRVMHKKVYTTRLSVKQAGQNELSKENRARKEGLDCSS